MPYSLGATSRAHLVGVHPDLVRVVERAIKLTPQDFIVQEGLRSIEQQRINVAKRVSRTMDSRHLKQADGYGHAVDLAPWIDGKAQWLWGEPEDHVGGCYAIAAAMRAAGIELKVNLRWGGVWDKSLLQLPEGAAGMRKAHDSYVTAFKLQHGRAPLCDGPHVELARGL